MAKIKAGIIGASGYTGFELIRILVRHPYVELVVRNSSGWGGKKIRELYPEFSSDITFTDFSLEEINQAKLDVLFLAMHEGYVREHLAQFKARAVIDLGRDLRFTDGAAYGLPELFRASLTKARVVANPGCYATACILSTYPLAKEGFAHQVIFDCKSGYSGAGRTPTYVNDPKNYTDNVIAYKVTQHQHQVEIAKCLNLFADSPLKVSFTPHVIPTFRGILCTAHILLKKKVSGEGIRALYRRYYEGEPFVRFREDRLPELHDVQNTNLCVLGGFESDDAERMVIIATLDNLFKGAGGQAVQNMNILFGFPETTALQ